MQTLFSSSSSNNSSGFSGSILMSLGLTEVLNNGFNLTDLSANLPNKSPFKKPESAPILSPEDQNFTTPTPSSVTSMGHTKSHFVEKVPQSPVNHDAKNVKEKLIAALKEIIPHKRSLNLRMLVTYTVDNASSDVIVIDEILNRRDCESAMSAGSVLDLSQKLEDSEKPIKTINEKENTLHKCVKSCDSCRSTAVGIIKPTDPSPLSTLSPETTLLMLQALLTNNVSPAQFGSSNLSLPMNLTPPQYNDLKSPVLLTELTPSMTITNCENVLPNPRFESKFATPVAVTTDKGSRSSSPLSNHESSPPPNFKSLQKHPSQVNPGVFSRRYMHPRRFVCNQCRQQFSSLADLNRHTLELHNSFRCNFCKAKFTQRSNLQRHSLKHVGFKPFTCNICQKEYYRKDHLVRHIEVTHPNVDPRVNITTRLTSSECLDFLDNLHICGNSEGSMEDTSVSSQNETVLGSKSPTKKLEGGAFGSCVFTLSAEEEGAPEVQLSSAMSFGEFEQSQLMET